MEANIRRDWPVQLRDPVGQRKLKPRADGKTMVIDKGLGFHAFDDLLQHAADYIDIIKLGFGTSILYPQHILQRKIELAKERGVHIIPGGTFLEAAVITGQVEGYFEMIKQLGFTGLEVSDGTIEMSRELRTELILRGKDAGFSVFTEYGKKGWGSPIEAEALIRTFCVDTEFGAELVTVEARESGIGVGIFNEQGECDVHEIKALLAQISNPELLLWEAPLKHQQVDLIRLLGPNVNLGNIAPEDVLSLESLRRGLRSDTLPAQFNKTHTWNEPEFHI